MYACACIVAFGCGFQRWYRGGVTDGLRQVVGNKAVGLFGHCGDEYDNRCCDARIAKGNAFLQQSNAECNCTAFDGCSGSGYDTMTVGIGFDNGHDLRCWRDKMADCGNIVRNG